MTRHALGGCAASFRGGRQLPWGPALDEMDASPPDRRPISYARPVIAPAQRSQPAHYASSARPRLAEYASSARRRATAVARGLRADVRRAAGGGRRPADVAAVAAAAPASGGTAHGRREAVLNSVERYRY